MSNESSGTLKVVAKSEKAIERLYKILRIEDDEYFIQSNVRTHSELKITKEGEFFISVLDICARRNCKDYIFCSEDPKDLLVTKCTFNPKTGDWDMEYGTSHVTNLPSLAQKLGFGCEAFTIEPGCAFCEHFEVDHEGRYRYETDDYELIYPLGKNGEPDFDAMPKEKIYMEGFEEFKTPHDIWEDPNMG